MHLHAWDLHVPKDRTLDLLMGFPQQVEINVTGSGWGALVFKLTETTDL